MAGKDSTAVAAALAGSMLWGIIWLPLQALEARGVAGLWTTFLVFAIIGGLALPLVFASWKHGTSRFRPVPLLLLVIFGGLTNLLFFLALTETSVVRALMFFYLSPIWNLASDVLRGRHTLTAKNVCVVIISITGTAILLGLHQHGLLYWNLGDTLALLSGLCFSISVIGLQTNPNAPSWALTVLHWLGAAVMALICLIWLQPAPPPMTTIAQWLPLLLLFAFGNQATASLCILFALTRLESYRVNILMLFEIIVGTVSYALWSAESIKSHEWCGIGLILAASLLDNLRGRHVTGLISNRES